MILHVKETVIKVRKKHCGVSSRMHYLKFTFKGPSKARNEVFYYSLADFLKC